MDIASWDRETELMPHRPRVRAGWILAVASLSLVLCIAIVASAWSAAQLGRGAGQGVLAEDFMTSVWRPGRALAEGESPMRSYTGATHNGGTVYPAIATLVTAPLSLPPYRVAVALWLVALAGSVFAGLWLCGVRDWRCYLAAFLSPPVVAGLAYANASLVLVLAVALVWRYRDRRGPVAAVLGLAVAAKLFLWPLVLWLALTRRWRSFALSLAVASLLSVGTWAVIGFDELADYPSLMRTHASLNDQDGASLAALAAQLGLPGNTAIALGAAIAALGVAVLVRRDDISSFTWALTAAVLASPMVWTHYYALLVVPLALLRPRWSFVWLVLFAFYPHPAAAAVGVVTTLALATWISATRLSASAARASRSLLRPQVCSGRTSSRA